MKHPLSVLFLLEDLCYGGTQKQLLELAARLDRNRFAPSILTLTGPTDLDDQAARSNIPLLHIGASRKVDPLFFGRLPNYIKKFKPDIIVPGTALPNIWGRIWGKLLSVPVIIGTCRGGGAPARQHERYLWRFADHIICNSQASIEAMADRGVPRKHMSFIANGLDLERFHPTREKGSGQLILCVARICEDKDHETLIKAFASIAPLYINARLRLVGEGPLLESVENLVKALPPEIATRIELPGACNDPAPHYDQASIFALSSIREGQPNTILEAMASGLPVCATRAGGIPDLVSEGQTGLLSVPGDSEGLAHNLALLLGQSSLRLELGQAARKFVEKNFSFTTMVENHAILFERLAASTIKK